MKILILGGTNYIGKYLLKDLNKSNSYSLTVLNRGISEFSSNFTIADRNDSGQMKKALFNKEFDVAIDFSGYFPHHIRFVIENCKVKNYVFCSSTAVYKQPLHISPTEDYSKCAIDENKYGFYKHKSEDALIDYSRFSDMSFKILRPVYIYGLNNPQSRFFRIFHDLQKGNISVVGDGNNYLQFIFILDFIKLIMRLTDTPENLIVNVANPQKIKVNDLIELCSKTSGKRDYNVNRLSNTVRNYKVYSPFPNENRIADTSSLHSIFDDFTKIEDGLDMTYKIYKINQHE